MEVRYACGRTLSCQKFSAFPQVGLKSPIALHDCKQNLKNLVLRGVTKIPNRYATFLEGGWLFSIAVW